MAPWSLTTWGILMWGIETGEKRYWKRKRERKKERGKLLHQIRSLRSLIPQKISVTFFTRLLETPFTTFTATGRRNGYVSDYRYLLPLLWDVWFNQAAYRPANSRNALPGGNDHQTITNTTNDHIAPAKNIFDFSQDPRTSRLLPAIDRAFYSDLDNSYLESFNIC